MAPSGVAANQNTMVTTLNRIRPPWPARIPVVGGQQFSATCLGIILFALGLIQLNLALILLPPNLQLPASLSQPFSKCTTGTLVDTVGSNVACLAPISLFLSLAFFPWTKFSWREFISFSFTGSDFSSCQHFVLF